ncbi:MAG: hypothetical protein ACI9IP_002918 [Arcticibacterium sp.]|jgi:hypothetical protein
MQLPIDNHVYSINTSTIKKLSLSFLVYFLPNLVWSCIDCGQTPKNFINGVQNLEVVSVSTLEETFQNRYGGPIDSNNPASLFALKLNVIMAEDRLQASNLSGYSCYACSLAPPYMASEIESIKITFSDSFNESPSGEDLRDYFVIDPLEAYTEPFQYKSLSTYERTKGRTRTADRILFLYNDSLKQNIEGIFTIDLVADGISYKAESESVTLNKTN